MLITTQSWLIASRVRVWEAGRSLHHSRVDGNLMAVVERENSSLPLSLPIVHQSSRDSIRQPSDCKLILSLSGHCQRTAYCYCCHFSIVWHDNLSAYLTHVEPEVFTVCALLLILFFSQTRRNLYVHKCSHTHKDLCRSSFSTLTLFLALFFLLPADLRFPQLFMSHLLGQVLRQMCVKQDLICPPVHLLIVSSSACWSRHWGPSNTQWLVKGLQLDSLVHHVQNNLFNLMCASLFKIIASGSSML